MVKCSWWYFWDGDEWRTEDDNIIAGSPCVRFCEHGYMTSSGSSKHCQTQNRSLCCGWLPIQATNGTALYCRLISLLPRAPEGFSVGSMVNNPPANAGETGLILGLGRSPEGGHSNPLQHSCLENSMDRGAWPAVVHGVAKSWTQLKD